MSNVPTLCKLAAHKLPNPLLRLVTSDEPLDLLGVIFQGSHTPSNVRAHGRCARPSSDDFTIDALSDTRLRIDSLRYAAFWFELDLSDLKRSAGQICNLDHQGVEAAAWPTAVYRREEPRPSEEQIAEAVVLMKSDPNAVVLPRRGHCWHAIRFSTEEHSPTLHYRVDCFVHLESWFEVTVFKPQEQAADCTTPFVYYVQIEA